MVDAHYRPLSPVLRGRICAAWAILLKDYLGTPTVVFAVQDESSARDSGDLLQIELELTPEQTVGELLQQIEDRLQLEPSETQTRSKPPICTQLWIEHEKDRHENQLEHYSTAFSATIAFPEPDIVAKCTINQHENGQVGFCVRIDTASSMLSKSQAGRMQQQFGHVIRQLSTVYCESDRSHAIQTASPQDLYDVWSWNASVPPPILQTVWQAFSALANDSPEDLAIDSWDGCLTYSELHGLSTMLCHRLVALGVERGIVVPLFFEKSQWTAVAVLATVKAGAAFCLIDEALPRDRVLNSVKRISNDGMPQLVISSSAQEHRARQISTKVVIVDHNLKRAMKDTNDRLSDGQPASFPSDAVYTIFTSGTTGTPKAVVIRHENLCTLISMHAPTYGVSNSSRILDHASYAFDVSLGNMFLSLLSGACLCIPSPWENKNDIVGAIKKYGVSFVDTTPSISRLLIPSEMPKVRVLNLGGEACREADLERWRDTGVRVMNTYGPAECTIGTVVNADALNSSLAANMGKGLGVVTWIVDPSNHERLCPIGAVGELALEGPLVGGGYYNDQKATDAAFKHNPRWLVSGCPGVTPGRLSRLYFTGDLVRYMEDGSLEFIGRRDSQVKVRGQRLELAELTTHAQRHLPPLSTCCADLVRLQQGVELLVMFVSVPKDATGSLLDMVNTVDQGVRASLPAAMAPNAYMSLDDIPLTLSGKTDHAKLKQIAAVACMKDFIFVEQDRAMSNPGGVEMTAATGIEATLLHLWGEVLGIDTTNVQSSDTFFSHGGESLSAMNLVHRAAQQGLHMSVRDILRSPRLSDMALHCRSVPSQTFQAVQNFSLLGPEVNADHVMREIESSCHILADNIDDAYPCTPMQEGLIVAGHQRAGAYVGKQTLRLPDHVDPARLARAWAVVVENNPILRTRIVNTQAWGLIQVILKKEAEGQTSNTANDMNGHEETKPIKLGLGTQLCHWEVVTDPECGQSDLVLMMHHAIYDGWSLPRIGAEVFRVYQGIALLPSPKFNLFIKHIRSLSLETGRFWENKLAEPQKTAFFPQLPAHIDEPKADSTFSKLIQTPIHYHLAVSVPSLVRASWLLLISKLLGTDDVTIGTTVSGRNVSIPGIQDMLAPTISTIPVRIKLDISETVSDYLKRVQDDALDAMPFENLGLRNIRKLSSSTKQGSMFQTLLIVHPPELGITEMASESPTTLELQRLLTGIDVSTAISNFNTYALMVLVSQRDQGLLIEASYDSRILEPLQVQRTVDQFAHILSQLADKGHSTSRLMDINYVSESDIDTLWKWNDQPLVGRRECVHETIQQVARAYPEAEAVRAWDGSLTYHELDQLSSQLARVLTHNKIGEGHFVPICMEKSKWASMAMLGVIKSGAAFVAMDVTHQPKQRLQTIIDQVGARSIITAGPGKKLAQELSKSVIVCEELREASTTNGLEESAYTTTVTSTEQTAFAVFTSGSTGTPKGIIITHGNFCSSLRAYQESLELSMKSRVYDYASYSFDIAAHNALATLMLGGCLCVPSEDDRENNIEGSIRELEANWADMTPSVARLVDPSKVPSLKTLVLGGELVGKDLILQWAHNVKLINIYGPAECQVCTVQTRLKSPNDGANIGKGAGCATWVIDPEGDSLVPIGAIGELAIEGPIVSPGYIHASAAEHPAWMHSPKWLTTGTPSLSGRKGVMYRTGDLVRYAPDGTLVYQGRATAQVKINGQRVELGEIEYHLIRGLPGLRGAVVDVLQVDGVPMLAAFLLFDPSIKDNTTISALANGALNFRVTSVPDSFSADLRSSLPAYMIPSLFIQVSHLPLTTTGKIDRLKLKECGALISRDDIQCKTPKLQTAMEEELDVPHQKMQNTWSQVLRLEPSKIGRQSEFFQLGGDSIMAMHLVKSGRDCGLVFTVADVLRNSRLEDLVRVASKNAPTELTTDQPSKPVPPFSLLSELGNIDGLKKSAASTCGVPIDSVEDLYPCTPLQEAFFALTASDPTAYVQHTELRVPRSENLDRVISAWEAVIANSAIFRTRIVQTHGSTLLQAVVQEPPEWHWYDTLDEYLQDASKTPTYLGSRLNRFAVIRQNDPADQQLIVWTVHHALYDWWTIQLALDQVTKVYHKGRFEPGPQYNLFVQHVQKRRSESQKWWNGFLSEAHDVAPFPPVPKRKPADKPRQVKQGQFAIPNSIPPGCTIVGLVRATWALLSARLTGCESIVFGETHTGRDPSIPGIGLLKGPTLATVPILARVGRDLTIGSFLNAVRDNDIEMQPFEHLGLQHIAQLCEDARIACNFQTLIVFQTSENALDSPTGKDSRLFEVCDSSDDIRNFSSYPLMLVLTRNKDVIDMELVYHPDVLDETLVDFLTDQVGSLFRRVCEAPFSTLLRDFDKASDEDIEKIWERNQEWPEIKDRFLHDMFAEQATKIPHELAVAAHDHDLTFRQLDLYSSKVASILQSHGVGLGHFIPICFEKSAWVTVCQLAVNKVAAAFALMDISHPPERLQHIVTALEAPVILASTAQEQLSMGFGTLVVIVGEELFSSDTDEKNIPGMRFDQHLPPDTNRPLCISFTSGSTTGFPKMAVYSHRNIASTLAAQIPTAKVVQGTRVFDFSTYGFDMTLWSTFATWMAGACLCTPRQSDKMDRLTETMREFKSEVAFFIPSLARTLDPTQIPTLKTIMLGGEAVTPLEVSLWKDHVRILNFYGPTECTPVSLVSRLEIPERASVIGKGTGAIAWVATIEDHNELAAIGVIGELLVEGPGVCHGYHTEPEKTEAAFVSDLGFLLRGSNSKPGRNSRVYRTGDLVRWRYDGSVEYIGRADTQAKLRGQRLDFGEISFQLKQALPEASVVCIDIIAHPKRDRQVLVAFCQVDTATISSKLAAVKRQLGSKLPKFMIPEAFLALEDMPLTKNGKLDRRRLKSMGPDLLHQSAVAAQDDTLQYGPLTKTEDKLRDLWVTVLGHETSSIQRNSGFFDMGGDSISAMKLSGLARERDMDLTVKTITMNPELSAMALSAGAPENKQEEQLPFSLLGSLNVSETIAKASEMTGVPTNSIIDLYPCTPVQLELFSITMSYPSAYMRRCVFEVPDHINFDKLIRAWDTVIELNEILRSRFVEIEGLGLAQVVIKGFKWEIADDLQAYLDKTELRVDLGSPLSRLAAIREGGVGRIVWTVHHALYDEWSIQIIEEQLRKAYRGEVTTIQSGFKAFVKHVISQDMEEGKKFWTSRLAEAGGALSYPPLPTPTYRARPTCNLVQKLNATGTSRANLQATIHAAWALVVSELIESTDIIFGATFTGRDANVPGIDRIVGPTLMTMPVRVRVDKHGKIGELLDGIESDATAMRPVQHMGLSRISAVNHDTKAACKFQTLITVLPFETGHDAQQAIKVASYEVANEADSFYTFPLVMFFSPDSNGIDLEVIFDPAVLSVRDVQRLRGRLERVITQLGEMSTDTPLGRISCVGKEDHEDIWEWNSVVPAAAERCLHHTILENAPSWPTRMAIEAWDCKMTYANLDSMSSNLCYKIRNQSIGQGSIVPILSAKSGYVPGAALGVLKAGAAFVPLDANLPVARLQAITSQVSARVILTTKSLVDAAQYLAPVVIIMDDEDLLFNSSTVDTNPACHFNNGTPDDVACVLFTSGTTGTPKGVLQTHRALSTSVKHQTEMAGFHQETRAFEFASYAFDVSWDTMFKVLSAGGCLCVPNEQDRQNDLTGAFNCFKANHVMLTPSVARLLDPTQLPSLENIVLGGEPVDLREFRHWAPKVRVMVSYGPSECTSAAVFNFGLGDTSMTYGIGKGVGSVTWIVDADDHTRLAPIGAVGELLLEGPLLGAGYHDDPVRTRASYVSDLPWLNLAAAGASGRSSTLYKTGDLVRYNSRGYIHFVARKDTQVKIRGQRVELEEVQHHVQKAMSDHVRSVTASLVTIASTGTEKILAAFLSISNSTYMNSGLVSPGPEAVAKLNTVDENLRHVLPVYMVPTAYLFVAALPRTKNGKVDRARLAEIALHASEEQIYRGKDDDHKVIHRALSTPTEKKMQEFWAASLQIDPEKIGADASFFHCNGDSISAMRLVALARAQGFDLRVPDVLGGPKLSEMSAILDSRAQLSNNSPTTFHPFQLLGKSASVDQIRADAAEQCGITVSRLIEDAYPSTPLQENMMAATLRKPGAFVSTNIYRIPNIVNIVALRKAWKQVVAQNPILRTRLVDLPGFGFVQAVLSNDFVWITYSSMKEFTALSREQDMGLGSTLTRWALIQPKQEHGGEHLLVWTIHHALYDGWTLPMIEAQVDKAYFNKPALGTHGDMRLLVHYLSTTNKSNSIDFWSKELEGAAQSTIFPTITSGDYNPQADSTLKKTIAFPVVPSARGTISALLYASWSLLLYRITGSEDVTFGTILTGRNAPVPGIDNIMGPTITTVPIRARLDTYSDVQVFVSDFQERAIRIMPHEHLGIPEIRRINTHTKAACEFQTVLVIQPASSRKNDHSGRPIMEEIEEGSEDGVVVPDQMAALNQYALMLEVVPDGDALTICASFDSNIISPAQMERTIDQWGYILDQFSSSVNNSPCMAVKQVSSLCSNDLGLIWERNHQLAPAAQQNVHDMVTASALRWPEAAAIHSWDGQLSYEELDKFSSLLAHQLGSHHVRLGSFVPLLFEKSMWVPVAMVGTLKAGAAFVPLASEHPEGRLRGIMQSLNASVILCSAQTRDLAARLAPHAMIVDEPSLNDLLRSIAPSQDGHVINGFPKSRPSNLAYATFTSGSTGTPKGVKITHANLASAIRYQPEALGFQRNTRSLDSSSYAFDACVFNLFYTITQGGCLCIPSESSRTGDLGTFMKNFKVNLAQLTPSVARSLDPKSLPDLECLILTGEPLTRGDISTWASQLRLLNVYGPSECTIMCAGALDITDPSQACNVGRGLGANLWLTELKDTSKLCPVGGVGEIIIEGPLVGAGYMGQEGDHATSLVHDPPWLLDGFNNHAGRRGYLFRTGDMGKYNDDGTITYIGRIGSETKLRGQRVDLADVEDNLRRLLPQNLELAADVVFLRWGDGREARQMLLSFVSSISGSNPDKLAGLLQELGPEISIGLDKFLPPYLKPEAFAVLQQMPKTSSGKVDRRRLKEIGSSLDPLRLVWIGGDGPKISPTPPATPMEKQLAELWSEILGLDLKSISRQHSFFRLGGDSIAVMRLTTIAHKRGLRVAAPDVFKTPQLKPLAETIEPLKQALVQNNLPCLPYSLLPQSLHPSTFIDQHVAPALNVEQDQVTDILPATKFQADCMTSTTEPFGLQYAYLDIEAYISWKKLVSACRTMVQSYESLRSRFVQLGDKYYQVILRDAPLSVEEVSTQEQLTSYFNRFCTDDPRQATVSDIFTKVTLVNVGQGRRRVIVRLSHAQYDGWCTEQIFRSLEVAYNDGEIAPTPPFSQLLHHRREQRPESQSFWRSLLERTTQTTPPLIYKPGMGTRTLRTIWTTDLNSAGGSERMRPAVIINVAWALVLAKLTDSTDLVFGNVTTGRNGSMPGLHEVIGPCVNMVPMKLNVPKNASLSWSKENLLKLVEESTRQVDERLPFEGLDWDDLCKTCTNWPEDSKYSSSVHFRNMEFTPNIQLKGEGQEVSGSGFTVGWDELVATPKWTTVLLYPEDSGLRIWLYANPWEIGEDGADEILEMILGYAKEIVAALQGDT